MHGAAEDRAGTWSLQEPDPRGAQAPEDFLQESRRFWFCFFTSKFYSEDFKTDFKRKMERLQCYNNTGDYFSLPSVNTSLYLNILILVLFLLRVRACVCNHLKVSVDIGHITPKRFNIHV